MFNKFQAAIHKEFTKHKFVRALVKTVLGQLSQIIKNKAEKGFGILA